MSKLETFCLPSQVPFPIIQETCSHPFSLKRTIFVLPQLIQFKGNDDIKKFSTKVSENRKVNYRTSDNKGIQNFC